MVQIPSLKKNDVIGILSTARKIKREEIQPAIELLQFWGLQVKIGKSIGLEDHQFAGSDKDRAEDLQSMLDDQNIRAIWCARGGYGTVRIIDQLDFTHFKKKPKWIIGYSDITVLHAQLNILGFESIHAQIAHNIDQKSEAARSSLKDVLFGNPLSYELLFSEKNRPGRTGTGKGELVGGNLSILYSLLGSPSAISTSGKILFIEDLDEYLYHVDRMLQNLKRNGMFENIKGLIVGGMSDMNDNDVPFGKTAEEIVWESIKEYDFPVCFGFPAGHIHDNQALILGRKISLETTPEKTRIEYLG